MARSSLPDPVVNIWKLPAVGKISAYYAMSTTPENVEETFARPKSLKELPDGATIEPDEDGIEELAQSVIDCMQSRDPTLVFLIHGFNNDRNGVADMVTEACKAIADDPELCQRNGVVFVGYRWPAEKLPTSALGLLRSVYSFLRSTSVVVRVLLVLLFLIAIAGASNLLGVHLSWLQGLPGQWGDRIWGTGQVALLAILAVLAGLISRNPFIFLLGVPVIGGLAWLLLWSQWSQWWQVAFWLVLLLIVFMVPVGLFALRTVVYFRDAYRALNYAVPDLLDLVRALEAELTRRGAKGRVRLSFIGHSMGVLVVTHLVRVLADAFPVATPPVENSRRAGEQVDKVLGNIGEHFLLGRLVLLAADIPIVTLIDGRANFLKSSLRRFEEAYLFCNEGDEVLHMLSMIANSFSFPTARRAHGYRLGNAAVRIPVSSGKGSGRRWRRTYGISDYNDDGHVPHIDCPAEFTQRIHIGSNKLPELQGQLRSSETPFPLRFTYFDCTDYRDVDGRSQQGPVRGLLTRAKKVPRLPWWRHTALLVQYFLGLPGTKVDVHGGYLHGTFSRVLIYRLASLGFGGLLDSLNPGDRTAALNKLHQECHGKQIQVLLSPYLAPSVSAPPAGGNTHARPTQPSAGWEGAPGEPARRPTGRPGT